MDPCHLYGEVPYLDAHKKIAVIDTAALCHNYKLLKSGVRSAALICVVKADAYSHSANICVPALISSGCRFFAVSCIEEAIAVRNICRKTGAAADILILGYTYPSQVGLLAQNDIIQTAVSLDHAKALSRCAKEEGCTVRIHLAIDTGMNRIGISADTDERCRLAIGEIESAISLDNLKTEGIFTHFSKSDEEPVAAFAEDSQTHIQARRFIYIKNELESKGIKLFCHACNSAAAVRFPEYALDGVRAGIMLYGIYPSENFADIGLLPVMSLSTVISHIHCVPAGGQVSYGGTFIAEKDMFIATLPIGYADGFLRKYSGAEVKILTDSGTYSAQIIGRICMDQCMIDIGDAPAKVGDRVILFGEDPNSLHRLSKMAETIEYECICLVSARVPRIKK